MLNSILESASASSITLGNVLLCTVVSLILGIGTALIYMYKNAYAKNFVITLALLPAIVQAVIMLVNGNLGTGIAVLGAFSLIRFRSVPGSAKDIGAIFFAMAIGLATGMGYLAYALIFLILIGAVNVLLVSLDFGARKRTAKELRITIPENLDYAGLFDDLFKLYTDNHQLVKVKTSNMGSLYTLYYQVLIKSEADEKRFIDALRCRNGNLTIVCGHVPTNHDEL